MNKAKQFDTNVHDNVYSLKLVFLNREGIPDRKT